MKSTKLGLSFIAVIGLIVMSGCAGHTNSTSQFDLSNAERVEDPFASLPAAMVKNAQDPSQSEAHYTGAFPAMLADRTGSSHASVFLFDIPFRFDRFTLMPDARAMVEVNAMRLKESDESGRALLLEGRCDEIGSSDYNLVLGERRAQSVREYLVNLGIPSANIKIVSYGKDRPLCHEHDEICWAKNRTVRFGAK